MGIYNEYTSLPTAPAREVAAPQALGNARWVPEEPAPVDGDDADGDCRQAHYLLSLAYLRSEGACRLDAGRSIPAEILALSEADRAAHLAGLRGREWSGSYTIGQCWNEVGGGW